MGPKSWGSKVLLITIKEVRSCGFLSEVHLFLLALRCKGRLHSWLSMPIFSSSSSDLSLLGGSRLGPYQWALEMMWSSGIFSHKTPRSRCTTDPVMALTPITVSAESFLFWDSQSSSEIGTEQEHLWTQWWISLPMTKPCLLYHLP